MTSNSHKHLKSIIERIEKLNEEKAALASDIKDIFAEAKSAGYDVKALRAVLADRKTDAKDVEELQNLVDNYKAALGMLADTPLGRAAINSMG